jgi:hypothetical protein
MEKNMLEGQLGQLRQDMKQYTDAIKEGIIANQMVQQNQFYGGPT